MKAMVADKHPGYYIYIYMCVCIHIYIAHSMSTQPKILMVIPNFHEISLYDTHPKGMENLEIETLVEPFQNSNN